jgi:hypothetical protein
MIRMSTLRWLASHPLLIRTNLGYGTVLMVACICQGCSTTVYLFIFIYLYVLVVVADCGPLNVFIDLIELEVVTAEESISFSA